LQKQARPQKEKFEERRGDGSVVLLFFWSEFMKKILSIILVAIICIIFSSCGVLHGNNINKIRYISSRDNKISEQTLNEILIKLENEEKSEFKKVFSKNALSEIKDIDERIDYLFEYYKGDFLSYSKTGFGHTEESSEGILKIMQEYYVETSDMKYILRFEVTSKDTKPENIGVNMLQICTDKSKEKMISHLDSVGLHVSGYEDIVN